MLAALSAIALVALAPDPIYFADCPSRTGSSATVVVPSWAGVSMSKGALEAGDELAVLAPDGSCVGSGVWSGDGFAIAVWGDDPFTPVLDGLLDGDALSFAAYDATGGGAMETVSVAYDESFALSEAGYQGNDLYVLGASETNAATPPASDALRLDQTYPNPMRGSATVPFSLDRSGPVRLDVYDTLGRLVLTPVDGETLEPGDHAVPIDASGLAPGQYLYRLTAGGEVRQRSLTVVR